MTHPRYDANQYDWLKWRYVYEGGRQFIEQYLQQLSKREAFEDYILRRDLSYNPAFVRQGIHEIKQNLTRHFTDIARYGGPTSYQDAAAGDARGVDLAGSSMNMFVANRVLPELLVMGRVGVFVDMPQVSGATIAETQGARPYLYAYPAEDIRSWGEEHCELTTLLLRDYVNVYDEETGLVTGNTQRYRRFWIEDGSVWVQWYDREGQAAPEPIRLGLQQIPFYIFELSCSLLVDVADYQIALLNLASSDMAYVLKSNYPFYTEQYDPNTESLYLRTASSDNPGEAVGAEAKAQEIKVGVASGRRYPKGLERPDFINPSTDPLRASMEKQQQLKEEIRALLQLNLSSISSKGTSAEGKQTDEEILEAGLAAIARELENGERRIARYWAEYESSTAARVNYPQRLSLETEESRRSRAKGTAELISAVPSLTYKQELAKRVARILLGPTTDAAIIDAIDSEIDAADAVNSDWQAVARDVEMGLVDLETASLARGWPEGAVEKAKKDHEERLKRIAISQTEGMGAARGIPDQDGEPGRSSREEKAESRDTTEDGTPEDFTRGDADGSVEEE